MYLIGVTYSLTSVAGISTVQYDFAWGDHAAPGVYSRQGILAAFGCSHLKRPAQ